MVFTFDFVRSSFSETLLFSIGDTFCFWVKQEDPSHVTSSYSFFVKGQILLTVLLKDLSKFIFSSFFVCC